MENKMTPQVLNETQQKLLDDCKTSHRRYRKLKDEAEDASSRLSDLLVAAADAGVTRYRLGKEIGLTRQAVDSRVEYVRFGRYPMRHPLTGSRL